MKKIYIVPSIELVKTYGNPLMDNTGSVFNKDGNKEATIKPGNEGVEDSDGIIWADSKGNNAWSGWDE